ncbi:MAG: gliding motility lipoprotein GldD [Vicingaceae bacterium]|nr:gliding motility lipoprotein GldD [Vicingaceae bacterium]
MKTKNIVLITIIFLLTACESPTYTPKPTGYFRIELPEKSYKIIETDCSFSFEIPTYASIQPNKNNIDKPCWFDIVFNGMNASIYFSYKPVENNINQFLEDSRTLAFKHTVKAFDIEQNTISFPEKKVYGLVYVIEGNAASAYQFHLTDSIHHFVRGSLYFNNVPNQDSIQPVLEYIEKDIQHLFETFEWK